MDLFSGLILVFLIVTLAFNLWITNELIKDKVALAKFFKEAETYIAAFNVVKDASNRNAIVFQVWHNLLEENNKLVKYHDIILDAHSVVLGIKKPPLQEKIPEAEAPIIE